MNYRRRRNERRRDYRGPIISPRSLRVRQLSTRSRAEGRSNATFLEDLQMVSGKKRRTYVRARP